MRFKGIHVINQPWYLSVLMAIIRPFMSKKLADRVRSPVPLSTPSTLLCRSPCASLWTRPLAQIQIYGTDLARLHERFPPEILPKEFGGTLKDDWDVLAPYEQYLDELPAE